MISPTPARPFSKPNPAPVIRFGRDAWFERNTRFRPSKPLSTRLKEWGWSAWQYLTYCQSASDSFASPLAHQHSETSQAVKPLKITSSANSNIQKPLADIQIANALIAEDKDNQRGFHLLDKAIQTLDALGYPASGDSVEPSYIHGLYNRGAYFFNNDVYRETERFYGRNNMRIADQIFEGLQLGWSDDFRQTKLPLSRLRKDLPYLERAIALAEHLPDGQLAHLQYLSTLGEIQHALAHLSHKQENDRKRYAESSRATFQKILDGLNALPAEAYTPQHYLLAFNVGNIKLLHLQEQAHSGHSFTTSSKRHTLDQTVALLHNMRRARVKPPKLTNWEKKIAQDNLRLHS